jgi:hypothetical protein
MSRLTKPGPAPTGYAYSHLPSAAGKSLDIMQHLHKPYKGAASKHPAIQEMRKPRARGGRSGIKKKCDNVPKSRCNLPKAKKNLEIQAKMGIKPGF